ncbi:FtsK/SpoIIIE domain-containing protein [Micromonospora sp. NPDC049523]|uniref:FtsK/SpoIIIE domain-containing protein n=1 Tax=Micromonospora sp. NPDC049523 TaxID=3155921 RepID=UPI003416425C
MTQLKTRTSQAAALHRQAAAAAVAAAATLDATQPAAADQREQHELAERLRAAAAALVPGWLGAPLGAQAADTPLGGPRLPEFVRIGTAQPLDDARFPAVVPLLGTGHLTIDADTRDPRVAGLVRAVLLRLLAAAPAGSLLVRGVDAATAGQVFAPFAPLADAGLMPPPAIDRTGLRAVLAEAEQWVRPARPNAARYHRHERTLLLVIASLPELTEAADLVRIGALAQHGPGAGLHLIIAGWPPPPLTAETTQPPLPDSTMIALRNPYALVGDPPGASFGNPAPHLPSTGLNSPVFLDEDPPAQLFQRVCQELTAQVSANSRPRLAELLPDGAEALWESDPADGLVTTVGRDGEIPVTVRVNDLTPHWLLSGRPGAGKSAFLVNVLFGLCARYSPDDLALYLVDFADGSSFGEVLPAGSDPSWLPHARAVGMEADRAYGLAVLGELDAEVNRRAALAEAAGVSRFADLRARHPMPRILCLLDGFRLLLDADSGGSGSGSDDEHTDGGSTKPIVREPDPLAVEASRLLASLARRSRPYGVHLVLVNRAVSEPGYGQRDSVYGQFPVRIALPGGGEVLEPTNDAAAGLPMGSAVVNTAGGLGGPRGATRGHERVVQFPDPQADPLALGTLRQRLWQARPDHAVPPTVFAGYAEQYLDDDPAYRAAYEGLGDHPAALVGRVVGPALDTATIPFDKAPGRNLVILGPDPVGADVLDAAARSLAAHHPSGTARFVITSLVPAGTAPADRLAAHLAERHEVMTVDAAGLAHAFEREEPGYLVVFGLDGLDPEVLPTDRLTELLDSAPARGVHLLAWAQRPGRLTALLGAAPPAADATAATPTAGVTAAAPGAADAPGIADAPGAADAPGVESAVTATVSDLVLLDLPAAEVAALTGQPVRPPRPGRALWHDRLAGRTSVIVPFVRPEVVR